MAARPASDRFRLYVAAFLRSLGVGMTGVLLALYLHAIGWDAKTAGLLVSVGLAGAAVATLVMSYIADRLGRRRTLFFLALLTALGALALTTVQSHAILLVAAFFGMINGLGRDRGPAYALEQALLAETTTHDQRTMALAWYSLTHDAGLALGSLLAGLPFLLREHWGWPLVSSYQAAWLLSAVLVLVSPALYATLSPAVEAASPVRRGPQITRAAKRIVGKLAALTAIDSLGGGFLTGALIAYWFFRRFHAGEELLAPLFFAARVANAVSHLAAAWLARRIGLLNTMVFTHIPSSLSLILVPFAPTLTWAAMFFLVREVLVEMDVPTRQSYILAVVQPEERTFSTGITTLTRNVAYAVAPAPAGYAMQALSLASPLFLGAGIKIAYDLLLYASFRRLKPPEEAMEG